MFFVEKNVFEIKSSPIWYSDRESYSESEVGKPRISHNEVHGFETLNGSGVVSGKLYGGCIESIYDALTGVNFPDEHAIYENIRYFRQKRMARKNPIFRNF